MMKRGLGSHWSLDQPCTSIIFRFALWCQVTRPRIPLKAGMRSVCLFSFFTTCVLVVTVVVVVVVTDGLFTLN